MKPKPSFQTSLMALVTLALIVLAILGALNDKYEYHVAQKFISLQNCKEPTYKGQKVKYIKQFYEQHTMEIGLDNGDKLTLPYDQVMHILCK